jgi:exonuclease SbcD
MDALKTYLTSREDLLGFQTEMIEAAQLLLAGE